ncbi:DUF6247 family protein [Herbidospora galbida]|uniref:DUF6247 family protein n=1 Tax=Herbidospora galbida TaxID=2575442 RepID=UPI001485A8E8|nr:DUF6247 family protein [Herbidospora galbida]
MSVHVVESLMADRSPRNIRACLPGDDRTRFDTDFQRAMAQASDELDLTPVNDVLAHWWHIALMKTTGEYEAVLTRAAAIQEAADRGETGSGRPWREILAERAAELGQEPPR